MAGNTVKVIGVVGARPNFMKMAPVLGALNSDPAFETQLVHTGQHYDANMSGEFFDQLGLPRPSVSLEVGSANHGVQTGEIMIRFQAVCERERPDAVIVVGDVNSTVAAALVAAKLGIKIAHVEAGLRSRDRSMPEEINRIVTDALSDFCFTPSRDADDNLEAEGVDPSRIFFVGNVMVDTLRQHLRTAKSLPTLRNLGLMPNGAAIPYGVLTLHRPSNVDGEDVLRALLTDVLAAADLMPIIFPVHPRTRERLRRTGIQLKMADERRTDRLDPGLYLTPPLGYLQFLSLMACAAVVVTDSGGIQEETTAVGVPCFTLRSTTERPVTITQGTNTLLPHGAAQLQELLATVLRGDGKRGYIPELWDGHTAPRIAAILRAHLVPAAL